MQLSTSSFDQIIWIFQESRFASAGRPTLNLILCDSNKTSEALFSNSLHCVACLSVFLWIILFLPMHCISFSRGYIRFTTKVPVKKNAEKLILSWYLRAATGGCVIFLKGCVNFQKTMWIAFKLFYPQKGNSWTIEIYTYYANCLCLNFNTYCVKCFAIFA